jgi:hypothetical protein
MVMSADAPATEPRAASDHHDAVLALVLGSLRLARHFEASVARASAGSPPLATDDPMVVAALGAISLGRSLERWLEAAAEPEPCPHADRTTAALPPPRDLLR